MFRPDVLVSAVRQFISSTLGDAFVHVPEFDLAASFSGSDRYTPLILLLSPGVDPLAEIK